MNAAWISLQYALHRMKEDICKIVEFIKETLSRLQKVLFWENYVYRTGIAHNDTHHNILKSIFKPLMAISRQQDLSLLIEKTWKYQKPTKPQNA